MLTSYLSEQSRLRPNKTAVSDDSCSLTFRGLYSAALNLSEEIRREELRGKPVIVFAEKCVNAYAMLMGVLCSGNCYAPLDVKMPTERLKIILGKLNARLALTTSELADRLISAGFSGKVIVADSPDVTDIIAQPVRADGGSPAYILFTSGSTGEPKGVTVSHSAVEHHLRWQTEHLPISESAVLGNQAPFFFDASMPDIFTPLFTGAQLHILPERLFLTPNRLISHMNAHGVNTLFWVPSALVRLTARDFFAAERLCELRMAVFCGEVMPTAHLNRWRKYYPDAKFVNMYGPTEAAYGCTCFVVDREFRDDEPLPLGAPCEGTEILLDGGELCIIGERLALGYYEAPELTSARFVSSHDGRRMYRTGDLARYNSRGELEFLGRADRQIKRQGYRIELGEIEAAAYSCNGVQSCRALLCGDTLALFCAVEEYLTEKELYSALKRRLPSYMLPARIVLTEQLPLTPNGKTDEKRLAAMLAT